MERFGEPVEACQICGSKKIHECFSLGHQPPSDSFLKEEHLKKEEIAYPLDIYFCEDCNLLQLGYIVNPRELFYEGYSYNTQTSGELVRNFTELTSKVISKFNISKNDLVIDIGSNDGTLLENFFKREIRVLGIEPTGVARLAIEKKIPTLKKFFEEDLAEEIIKQYGRAKIITATNVFAHIKKINSITKGIEKLLADDGVFISESHYLLDLIEKMEYDSIYHEHLRYYSLKPLTKLFEMNDMKVFDAERITTHGGSIRVYACKKGAYSISDNIREIIETEKKAGLYSKDTFVDYGKKVKKSRERLMKTLNEIKEREKSIVGIGAPAKGNTLLNYCHINENLIDYLAEKSELKRGLFSPGMHLKVVDEEIMFKEPQPDYALILAWNLKDIIIPKIKAKGFRGKFIIPVPTPYII
jgi:2-polyprenyl-3-methyl-5-hydroxy-6-metoxy-1,4-benzoquinol methylase